MSAFTTSRLRRRPSGGIGRGLKPAAWRAGLVLGIVSAFACGSPNPAIPPLRLWSNDIAFQVTADPVPPPARHDITYKVVARDKTTGQAIEGGEGRIYATSQDRINTWDGLVAGSQPGTYFGKLNFITAGDWSMGLQFRRDSTQPIETLDWKQTVNIPPDEAPTK